MNLEHKNLSEQSSGVVLKVIELVESKVVPLSETSEDRDLILWDICMQIDARGRKYKAKVPQYAKSTEKITEHAIAFLVKYAEAKTNGIEIENDRDIARAQLISNLRGALSVELLYISTKRSSDLHLDLSKAVRGGVVAGAIVGAVAFSALLVKAYSAHKRGEGSEEAVLRVGAPEETSEE